MEGCGAQEPGQELRCTWFRRGWAWDTVVLASDSVNFLKVISVLGLSLSHWGAAYRLVLFLEQSWFQILSFIVSTPLSKNHTLILHEGQSDSQLFQISQKTQACHPLGWVTLGAYFFYEPLFIHFRKWVMEWVISMFSSRTKILELYDLVESIRVDLASVCLFMQRYCYYLLSLPCFL
jgi:hypothetical protein